MRVPGAWRCNRCKLTLLRLLCLTIALVAPQCSRHFAHAELCAYVTFSFAFWAD